MDMFDVFIIVMLLNLIILVVFRNNISDNNKLIKKDKQDQTKYFADFQEVMQKTKNDVIKSFQVLDDKLDKSNIKIETTQKLLVNFSNKVDELHSKLSTIDIQKMTASFNDKVEELESQITKIEKELSHHKLEILSSINYQLIIQHKISEQIITQNEVLSEGYKFEQLLKNKEEHIQRLNKTNRLLEKRLNKNNDTRSS